MNNKSVTLIDCEKVHKEHPDTFDIPSGEDIASITVGSLVKLILVDAEDPDEGNQERMWVIVESINEDGFVGILNNNPAVASIERGESISFARKNICQIYSRKRLLVVQYREFKRQFVVDVPANVDTNNNMTLRQLSEEADVRGVEWIENDGGDLGEMQVAEVGKNGMIPIEPMVDVPFFVSGA